MSYPVPANESERLGELEKLRAEEWRVSAALDRICAIVSKQLRTPVTTVSLVGAAEQIFPAKYGIDADRTSRDVAFCAHTIMSSAPLVVENAADDQRFANNELVKGEPYISAYAGVPLETSSGLRLGALCTVDFRPRSFSADEVALLSDLGDLAMAIIEARGLKLRLDEELRNSVATQAKLAESEEKFRSAYNYSPIGMALVSPEGRFLEANRALCRLLGYDEATLRTLDFEAVTHPDDLDLDLECRRRVLAGETDTFQMEKRYLHKDGHVVWIVLSVSLVTDADGAPQYFISQIMDISVRKAVEAEHEELIRKLSLSNKELESFAYVASHDLKAPLRVIDNASSWLEKDLADTLSDKHRKYLRLLRSRVQRMDKLLDDLLDYARVGRAADDRQGEIVTARKLVTDILVLLSPPPSFRIKLAPQLDTICIARMPLQQVLYNLINNAIKHHDRDHGTISIDVRPEADGFRFSVSDDGPGIPRQFQQQIFDMFRTLRPRDEVEGSGMGLALVKKIVEHMGGSIEVRSGADRGSSFTFTWPDTQLRPISGAAA